MNTTLKSVLDEVSRLSDNDQQALADQIEELIIARKIAVAEEDVAAGRVAPLDEAFQRIRSTITTTYGDRSTS